MQRFMKCINFCLCPEKEVIYNESIMHSNTNIEHEIHFDTSEIISIKKLSKESVYDIALPNSHNYIANGLVPPTINDINYSTYSIHNTCQ